MVRILPLYLLLWTVKTFLRTARKFVHYFQGAMLDWSEAKNASHQNAHHSSIIL